MQVWPPWHHCLCQQKGLGKSAKDWPGASGVLWEASLMSEMLGTRSQRRGSWHDRGGAVHKHHMLGKSMLKEHALGLRRPQLGSLQKGEGLFLFHHL